MVTAVIIAITPLVLTLLLAVAIVGIAFLLLGVRVLFVRGGKFPSSHVHDNAALRARGIDCAGGAERERQHR